MFMKVLMKVISSIMEKLMYIMLLLLLYIFIYTLIGMQVFGGKFSAVDPAFRMTFDSFPQSAFTVFDLLTMENWNDILNIALRTEVSAGVSAVYLISCIFIGNFIIMNLVLATMIGAFSSTSFDREKTEISNAMEIIEDLDLLQQASEREGSTSNNSDDAALSTGRAASISAMNKLDKGGIEHSIASDKRNAMKLRRARQSITNAAAAVANSD